MIAADCFPIEYAQTRFRTPAPPAAWPRSFQILTAFAPTGEHWSQAQNQAADQRLQAALEALGCWHHRLTGYSPFSGHSEEGWAAVLAPEVALELGARFRQHAIYAVDEDALWVRLCANGQGQPVGRFTAQLDP